VAFARNDRSLDGFDQPGNEQLNEIVPFGRRLPSFKKAEGIMRGATNF